MLCTSSSHVSVTSVGRPHGLLSYTCQWDTMLHAVSAWNIGRVADVLESMPAAILWIATGNAHYQTPHTDHHALCCLVSLLAPWRRQYQLYAPTVSCSPSWQHLWICVKEQSTLWPSVSYTALCKRVTWCDMKLNSILPCSRQRARNPSISLESVQK